MELAPRDMVSRAIDQEIRAGRGIDGKDYVYLDVRHLGRKVIEEKLPDITDFARVYQGVEPITEPVPDPADRALRDGRHPDRPARPGDPRRGRHGRARACTPPGEAACVSVHGANRLGTNSLVDLLVFGRRAGRAMADDVAGVDLPGRRRRRGRAGPRRARGHPRRARAGSGRRASARSSPT